MNTTTEHLKALLVDDGREFAMIRKDCLASLMAANESMGRVIAQKTLVERKHGEERRRYMANNKALLARNNELEEWVTVACDAGHAGQMSIMAVDRAIRKAPATCRMLGLIK